MAGPSFHWNSGSVRQSEEPELKLYNSFTKRKDKFVPLNGRTVTWYCCGPTVYDSSHMGHARAYITFDIIKRILRDYFCYDVFAVMNVTDIDDKIIKRARQKVIFEKYKKDSSAVPKESVVADIEECKEALKSELSKLTGGGSMSDKNLDKDKLFKLNSVKTQLDSTDYKSDSVDELIEKAKDALMDLIDKRHGHEVNDKAVFEDLARFYERDFFDDMNKLGIEAPDVLTRVTEYVPEIVIFINKLISKGFAYESNGSVYFDVEKFSAPSSGHCYAKLVPEAVNDQTLLMDGEGGLSVSALQVEEKRSPRDFALWKKSKAGEPSWESPWGLGRPGWHIECSVMASDILGQSIDIHGGGVDLKFPHHDNEIAQSEAYFGNNDWIRYFLHSGHLNIEGRKMSKSLKNFTTIKSALESYTVTQIRILFLLHEWSSTLDYSYDTMKEALSYEKYLSEFFLAVKDVLRADPNCDKMRKVTEVEKNLFKSLTQSKSEIHAHLCDSFNTPRVMSTIKTLISSINSYLSSLGNEQPNFALLRAVASYITNILQVFGAVTKSSSIGFSEGSSADTDTMLIPFLETFAQFREDARQCAFTLLKSCDVLRDDILPNHGVRLEDKTGGQKAVIKYVGKEAIERERKQAEELKERKLQEKENQKKRLQEQNAQNRVDPRDMFKGDTSKYSAFDDRGVPTHLGDGSEIGEAQKKKLVKQFEAQKQKFEKFLKDQKNATSS